MSVSDRLLRGGGGVLFCALYAAVGLIMATDWRGLRTKHVAQTMRLDARMRRLPPWRWFGTGNVEVLARRQDVLVRAMGWGFFSVGGVAALVLLVAVATAR